MLKTIRTNKYFILFILLIVLFLAINVDKIFYPKLGGDAVSAVLMAKASSMGLGVPYKDFWEYKPPGIFLLLDLWIKIFSSSMFSLRVLQLFLLLASGILVYLILKKIFSSFYVFIVGGLAMTIFLSPYLSRAFLPAELFGLFFSLAGLVSLLYFKNLALRFSLSAFLFLLSSQMKDPFGLTILAVIPPLVYLVITREYQLFRKATIFVATGFLLAVLLILGYLLITGSLNAYYEILNVKSRIFNSSVLLSPGETLTRSMSAFWHAKNIIVFFQYQTAPILFIWLFSFFMSLILENKLIFHLIKRGEKSDIVVRPILRLEFSSKTTEIITVIFYSLGSFIGFALGNKFDFHYLMQIVFPLYFFLALVIKSIMDNFRKILGNRTANVLLLPILIIFLFPKGAYLKSYKPEDYHLQNLVKQIYSNITAPDPDTRLENYINSKTDQTSCILSVYGWSTGETYLNAQRRPCTRFFLANITVEDWQKKEYRESIQQNPPEAIIYSIEGADMNVTQFEQEVINLTQIINKCYDPDPQYTNYSPFRLSLYFPRYLKEQLKICVKQNSL